jgi:hypothetical protein
MSTNIPNSPSETSQQSNFIVVIHGRGVLQTCIAKGTLEEVTQKAEGCLLSGFEVHVYSLKLTTSGRPTYLPEGINPLQQEFNMWDASDEFHDLTTSILNNCEEHTSGMAKRYLQQVIDKLQEEMTLLNEDANVHSPRAPSFAASDDTTTGT